MVDRREIRDASGDRRKSAGGRALRCVGVVRITRGAGEGRNSTGTRGGPWGREREREGDADEGWGSALSASAAARPSRPPSATISRAQFVSDLGRSRIVTFCRAVLRFLSLFSLFSSLSYLSLSVSPSFPSRSLPPAYPRSPSACLFARPSAPLPHQRPPSSAQREAAELFPEQGASSPSSALRCMYALVCEVYFADRKVRT